ncbi:hypothetical protein, partial [Streptomyces tricolor]|uniref:hypothetical protein n=1 Tax=Streptomyces tricolor TaxID=68277 RepID=UPI001ABFA0F0
MSSCCGARLLCCAGGRARRRPGRGAARLAGRGAARLAVAAPHAPPVAAAGRQARSPLVGACPVRPARRALDQPSRPDARD